MQISFLYRIPSVWEGGPTGYVAVGMGFQTVVVWRTFELRQSHQAVQPAAPALGVNEQAPVAD